MLYARPDARTVWRSPKAREIAVVSGWVAIKDRILMINAYTDYKDATTFDTLLAHTKDALMTTLKATR